MLAYARVADLVDKSIFSPKRLGKAADYSPATASLERMRRPNSLKRCITT